MRFRRSALFLTTILMLLMIGPGTIAQDAPETLVVSIWGFNLDIIEENVFQPFEEKYNVDVILDTGNNSDRLARQPSPQARSSPAIHPRGRVKLVNGLSHTFFRWHWRAA